MDCRGRKFGIGGFYFFLIVWLGALIIPFALISHATALKWTTLILQAIFLLEATPKMANDWCLWLTLDSKLISLKSALGSLFTAKWQRTALFKGLLWQLMETSVNRELAVLEILAVRLKVSNQHLLERPVVNPFLRIPLDHQAEDLLQLIWQLLALNFSDLNGLLKQFIEISFAECFGLVIKIAQAHRNDGHAQTEYLKFGLDSFECGDCWWLLPHAYEIL